VKLSAHSDLRGSDVRFGDDGDAHIGSDQGSEERDPNHLDDVTSHLYQSNLGASLIDRGPCGVVLCEQQNWSRERRKGKMLYARWLAARGGIHSVAKSSSSEDNRRARLLANMLTRQF
jgi:hypothetical protein